MRLKTDHQAVRNTARTASHSTLQKKPTTNFIFSVAASQVRDSCCGRHRSIAASTTVTCVPCAVLDTISSHHPLHCLSAAPLGGRQRVLLMGF